MLGKNEQAKRSETYFNSAWPYHDKQHWKILNEV